MRPANGPVFEARHPTSHPRLPACRRANDLRQELDVLLDRVPTRWPPACSFAIARVAHLPLSRPPTAVMVSCIDQHRELCSGPRRSDACCSGRPVDVLHGEGPPADQSDGRETKCLMPACVPPDPPTILIFLSRVEGAGLPSRWTTTGVAPDGRSSRLAHRYRCLGADPTGRAPARSRRGPYDRRRRASGVLNELRHAR